MAWDPSLLVDEEEEPKSGWDPSLLVEEEEEKPKSGWDPSLLVEEPTQEEKPPVAIDPATQAQLRSVPETLDLRQERSWLRKPAALMRPEEVQAEYEDIGRTPQEKALAERVRQSKVNLPPREAGPAESFAKSFGRTLEPLGATPYLLSASDEELANYVQARAQEVAEAPQPTGLGSLGELAGGIAGGLAYYGGTAMAGGGLPGLAVAGATQNAYEAFDRASLRALAEGKSPQEAAQIGKAAMGIGAVAGAISGTLGPARPATSLKQAAINQGVPFGAAAGAGRVVENVAEQALGLQTPTTEGAAETAITQAVLPAGIHAVRAGLGAIPAREKIVVEPQDQPIGQEAGVGAQVPVRRSDVSQVGQGESAPAPAATEAGGEVIPAAETITPKTAVFNGIQMAGPSFKYLNEKTGRWNDVSAETAKQRGITIPPEELAKAEAASVGPGAASPKEFAQRSRVITLEEAPKLFNVHPKREPPGSTPVGLPGEASPNIEVGRANKDYNLFNNINSSQWAFSFGRLGAAAKSAIERIFTGEFRMRESINKDVRVYVERTLTSLPSTLRKKGGKAFFDVLNGKTMEEIRADYEHTEKTKSGEVTFSSKDGQKVIAAAEQLKTRMEEIRTTMRDTMRESDRGYFNSLDRSTLEGLFRNTMGEGVDASRFDKAQMADALTLSSLPDDWGIADGTYLPHLFFGNLKVTVRLPGQEGTAFVTRAKTVAEAKARIYELTKNNPEYSKADFRVAQDAVVPADMIRLGDRNFWKMVGEMKESLGVSAAEIKEAQSGIIGRKASKQKWFGSKQHRQGFEGYSKDYKQSMTAYLNGFHRWKELSAMQRDVQPQIEQVRSEGRPNAANRLDEIMENLWGKPAKSTVEFDAFVRQIPGLRDWIKPLALDRWSRNVRSIASILTLRTVRFATVNRLQPLQGLYPVVGERLLVKGKLLQHSAEGKALLDEGGVSFDVGQYGEPGALGKLGDLKERFSGEKSNQELAFLSMFLHGQEQGMGRPEAIQYAKLRGQLMTQFTPLVSDIPKAFEGPFGQLAFQFKRFPIKQAELAAQLVRERNVGGLTRMLGVFAVMGGASFFMRQTMLDKEKQLRIRNALKSELGDKGADIAMYGLPGLVGADLSGSFVLGDEPFGANIYEKAGRQLAGPAVSLAYETGRNILKKTRQPMSRLEKTKAVIRRIPSLKPLAEIADLESGNVDVMTPDGEVKYRRALSDAIAGLGSFRSANEANKQLAINGIIELKKETQSLKNDVFTASQAGDDISKAIDAVKAFNTRWPEAAITGEELTGYVNRRNTGTAKTDEERLAGSKFKPLLESGQ